MKLLIICGPSGSGKSILEKNLITEYSHLFNKLPQVSTREKRSNERFGDPYIFVTPETFSFLKNKLIGRIISRSSIYRHQYGTLPDISTSKVNTLILSEDAIIDLLYQVSNSKGFFKDKAKSDVNLCIIGLNKDYDTLDEETKNNRYERTQDFLNKEKSVFNFCHKVFDNNSSFTSAKEVFDYLTNVNFI